MKNNKKEIIRKIKLLLHNSANENKNNPKHIAVEKRTTRTIIQERGKRETS